MDLMSIGMILDHIKAYSDLKTPPDKKVRVAKQSDIDALKR